MAHQPDLIAAFTAFEEVDWDDVGGFFLSTTGSQSWPLIFMLMTYSMYEAETTDMQA